MESWLSRPIVLQEPELPPGELANWRGHIPFAYWIVDVLRPKIFVELGVHTGTSYCAFCQAVKTLELHTACYGVDTWTGDSQAGFYGEDVFATFVGYHEPRYAQFSRLLRCAFDEALQRFADGSIDLIHVDGAHTYEDVRHDFESWLPKLSDRGVMLFHDINVREDTFGVWQLWEEVSQEYPSFSFLHGHGLGVLAIGKDVPDPVKWLVGASNDPAGLLPEIRNVFSRLGGFVDERVARQRLASEVAERDVEVGRLVRQVAESEARFTELQARLTELQARLTEPQARFTELQAQFTELQAEIAEQHGLVTAKAAQVTHLEGNLKMVARALAERQQHARDLRMALDGAVDGARAAGDGLQAMTASRGWRMLERYRGLRDKIKAALRIRRRPELPPPPAPDHASLHETIERSGLFDAEFYLAQYPDVRRSGVDPITDYIERGAADGRDPDPLFDTSFYLEQNPEVARAGLNPLAHFLLRGTAEGRDPNPLFDTSYYLEQYPDVADAGKNPLSHYKRHGAYECRNPHALFDTAGYIAQHPGSVRTGMNPLAHFLAAWRADRGRGRFSEFRLWVHLFDTLSNDDRAAIRYRIARLEHRPRISVVVSMSNGPVRWLRRTIDSLRSQLYEEWELCLADDPSTDPELREALQEYRQTDARIKVATADGPGAFEPARGELVAFVDAGDELAEHALYMVAEELNRHPDAAVIYTDEDTIDEAGRRFDPRFKPDWDPELFSSQHYLSHLTLCRSDLLREAGAREVGGDGSREYEIVRRVTESVESKDIRHIPHLLYHRRASRGRPLHPRTAVRVPQPLPLVSLIIPTRDRIDLLRTCVDGLLNRTDYPRLEIIIVDNGSVEPDSFEYFRTIQQDRRVRVVREDAPFNFAALNNLGARHAAGDVLGLLNNDLEVIDPHWLVEMVRHAVRREVGAVGALLVYPDGTVQHAGVALGIGGVAAHVHRRAPVDDSGDFGRAAVVRSVSAVTAACLIVRRAVYDEVQGLDENLAVTFNDVDFCLRIRERGYRNLFTPHARLIHHESVSRGEREDRPGRAARFRQEIEYMTDRWGDRLLHDPYFNPNWSFDSETPRLAFPPRAQKPWRAVPEQRFRAAASAARPVGRLRAPADVLDPRLEPYASQSNLDRVVAFKKELRWTASKDPRPDGLSVIVLNLNRPDLLIPLIQRMEPVFEEAKQGGWGFEVLIGDTGSTDPDVVSFYRTLPSYARVIGGLTYQFAKCNNEVFFKHAAYDTALFLNNDIIDDGRGAAFSRMRKHLKAHPETGVVGACLWFPDGRTQHLGIDFLRDGSLRGFCYHPGAHEVVDPRELNSWWTTPAVTGACLMIDSQLFERLGGFNEQYAAECQDVDLCLLARRLGYRTDIVNGGRLVHIENATRPKGDENWTDRQLFVRRWSAFVEAVDE